MKSPLTLLASAIAEVGASWETEAANRRARTPSDPAAEALSSCAAQLRERLAQIERDTAHLTVAEFAAHRGLSEQSVRRLCARGELEGAFKDVKDEWRIPREARRMQKAS